LGLTLNLCAPMPEARSMSAALERYLERIS
jgi:hypothetical protein